jgi:hypothetical protein
VALSTYDDPLLSHVALSRITAATHPDAHPLDLLQTVPGIGKLLSLVLLYDMHAIDRFPTGQDVVSSCRRVTCAKAAVGTRVGTSGKNIGHAHLPWAFAEAATLCRRHNPAGQHYRARLENKHAKGQALTILAHQLARAVYAMRKHKTALHLAQFLQSEGSRGGEPAASLDTQGISLDCACTTSSVTASLNAKVRIGLVSQSPGLCLDLHAGSCASGARRTQGRVRPSPGLTLTGEP